MNHDSSYATREDAADTRPILIVPYMWIGDFVRGHTVVRVLKQRWPNRPVDVLVTSQCAPLVDYMPGVRAGVVWDLPRRRLAVAKQFALAGRFRASNYATALVLPRTWKSAIAPALAGIPERIGFVGEARFGLINCWRWGERRLPRHIDKNAALALPDGSPLPPEWPVPQLEVPAAEVERWRATNGLGTAPAKGRSRRRSWPRPVEGCATSPAPICATASWRWPRQASRSRTIRGSCTSLLPSVRRRWAFSARPAPIIGH